MMQISTALPPVTPAQAGPGRRWPARLSWALPGALALVALVGWTWDGATARLENGRRLTRLAATIASGGPSWSPACADTLAAPGERDVHLSALAASWQSIAGCGAGSSTGVGGIKWVGRNVSGGMVNLQCQVNYTRLDDGYVYSVQNQLTADLGERWNVGVVVPYLYKFAVNPFGLSFDLSNQGLGDVNLLVTRRLGPIRATNLTLSVGLPTGKHNAEYVGNYLKQDRQLGAGVPSGSLLVDHVMDNLWGPAVVGTTLVYPGPENDLENYRAPSASVYGYAGYLLGPFVPSFGLSATAYLGADRDTTLASDLRPPWLVSANAAIEWSTDWLALLIGASLPYHPSGRQPWTAGVGLAISPL